MHDRYVFKSKNRPSSQDLFSVRRSRPFLLAFCGLLVAAMALLPVLSSSYSMLNLLMQVLILGVFAMSYDLLLGYTGIVSFGHALYFGIGAYMSTLFIYNFQSTMSTLLLSVLAALLSSTLVSVLIGYLALRVKNVYYAMFTLAISQLFFIVVEKWRSVTGGSDGMSFSVPNFFQHNNNLYYTVLLFTILIVFLVWRFTLSPAGKVLQAIRENETRVSFLGFNVLHFKILSMIVAGGVATLSGVAWALLQQFVSSSVFGIDQTINALLMTTLGGTGTLFGSFIGSALINAAQNWLPDLSVIHPLFARWYILFGLIYIFIVLFFPGGIFHAFSRLGKRKAGVDENPDRTVEAKVTD